MRRRKKNRVAVIPVQATDLFAPSIGSHLSARTKSDIERIEKNLLQLAQVDVPLIHRFAPGVYFREVEMPAGSLVIGHEHKTDHFNVVLTGRAVVMMDGVVRHIKAPDVFRSAPGVRKVLFIQETMRWATIHPTTETDLAKLEDDLIVKSAAFLKHSQKDAEQLMAGLTKGELACLG